MNGMRFSGAGPSAVAASSCVQLVGVFVEAEHGLMPRGAQALG